MRLLQTILLTGMSVLKKEANRLAGHFKLISFVTIVSRILGLFRDMALARYLGAGAIGSTFWLAFTIPNIARRLFGEGALGAAFLPKYQRLVQGEAKTSPALPFAAIYLILIALTPILFLTLAGVWFLSDVNIKNSGLGIELILMGPFAIFICVTAILSAMLQVHGSFGIPASMPIVLNVMILLGIFVGHVNNFDPKTLAITVSLGVFFSGIIQVLFLLLALRKKVSWEEFPEKKVLKKEASDLFQTMLPLFFGLGFVGFNTIIDGLIATGATPFIILFKFFGLEYPLGVGTMTSLFLAQRLYMFPIAIFGIAISTAAFPALSRHASDTRSFQDEFNRARRLSLFMHVPAAVGLCLVSGLLVGVFFEGGAFGADDRDATASILIPYALGLPLFGFMGITLKACYALEKYWLLAKIFVFVSMCNFILNLILIIPFQGAGLALSTTICAFIQLGLLHVFLHRELGEMFPVTTRICFIKALIASMIMAPLVFFTKELMGQFSEIIILISMVVIGGVAFFCTSHILKVKELKWIMSRS